MKKIIYPIFAVAIFMAMQTIVGVAFVLPGIIELIKSGEALDSQSVMASVMSDSAMATAILVSGILTVVAISLMRMVDWASLAKRINWVKAPNYLLAAAFGIFACDLLEEMLDLPNLLEEQILGMARTPIGMLAIGVVGPICEEFIFREGILGFTMRNGVKPWTAIIVSSLVFGLIHGNPAQVPFAAAMGIVLGYIYVRTGNIILPSIVHIINNSVAVWEMNALGDNVADFSLVESIGGIPVAIGAAAACALLCYWLFRASDKNKPLQTNS